MKTACIYHSIDNDGYCSAAIVKLWAEENQQDITFIGYNYGQPLPDLSSFQKVIMVDISFPKEEMLNLRDRLTNDFIWCDHHISAIKDNKDVEIEGEQATNYAACELTWMYFFPNKPIPLAVQYLGIYDSWRNQDKQQWDNVIMPFQYGIRLDCKSFETFPMELIKYDGVVFNKINKILEKGEVILQYQRQQNERTCQYAFQKRVRGYKAICVNAGGQNSQIFDSIWDPTIYDIMVLFFYNGKYDRYTFSFYSTKEEVDCSEIAKSFGGGGHKGAAGCQTSDFNDIWDK